MPCAFEDAVWYSPVGDWFISKHVRPGILPGILTYLLSERKKAKTELKRAKAELKTLTGEKEKAKALEVKVLDGMQLAFKVTCNSVYGFTGAIIRGRMPCYAISNRYISLFSSHFP